MWKTGSGPVAYCQKPDQMIPAHRLASKTDEFSQTLARSSRSDPVGFFHWKNGCGKSDPAYTIRPDSGCTLAVIAITGHNQNASGSDPACLLEILPLAACRMDQRHDS